LFSPAGLVSDGSIFFCIVPAPVYAGQQQADFDGHELHDVCDVFILPPRLPSTYLGIHSSHSTNPSSCSHHRYPFHTHIPNMSLHVPATDVVEFLSDRRFHRCYILPPSPETGRQNSHRFSYADFGDPHSNAVVLFCGGLMAARYCYSPLDQLAKKHNVRILQVDRPGIGGTEPIELEKRIQIWLGQHLS
jgi:hypothetical protein